MKDDNPHNVPAFEILNSPEHLADVGAAPNPKAHPLHDPLVCGLGPETDCPACKKKLGNYVV